MFDVTSFALGFVSGAFLISFVVLMVFLHKLGTNIGKIRKALKVK